MDPEAIRQFVELLRLDGDKTEIVGVGSVLLSLSLSLVCSLIVAWVYRRTHQGAGYRQSFVHTLVMIALVTTLIMVVVGSNIARAFSLLGALSIIRFRNAVKDTRDVGFLFFAMAAAMAAGTRFYSIAVLATLFIAGAMIALYVLDWFSSAHGGVDQILRIHLAPERQLEEALGEVLRTLFDSYREARSESVQQGAYNQVTLLVQAKPGVTGTQIVDALRAANDNLKVVYTNAGHGDPL